MVTDRIFEYSVVTFIVAGVLFNVAYFFVVLPRLTSCGEKIGLGAFFTWGQPRRVKAYLALLSETEARLWYNVALRWSSRIAIAIWAVGMISFLLAYLQR